MKFLVAVEVTLAALAVVVGCLNAVLDDDPAEGVTSGLGTFVVLNGVLVLAGAVALVWRWAA